MPKFHVNEQVRITDFLTLFKAHESHKYLFPGESHKHREIIYVLNGEIQTTCDDISYQLKAGDIFFYEPLTFHNLFVNDKNGCDFLICSFFATGPILDFFDNRKFTLTPEQKILIGDILNSLKVTLFGGERCDYYLQEHSSTYLPLIAQRLELLCLLLYKHYYESGIQDAYDETIRKKAVKYMHSNISDQLSVTAIAEHCEISVSKLKRIFSERYNIGVHQYFINLKICRAIQLLREGMNVSQITNFLGFSSQPYFTTCFKRETGFTPSEYRDKYL